VHHAVHVTRRFIKLTDLTSFPLYQFVTLVSIFLALVSYQGSVWTVEPIHAGDTSSLRIYDVTLPIDALIIHQAKVLIGTSKQLQILLIDDQGSVADETFRGEHAASLGVVS
jgi:hypothetical protein